MSTSLVDSAAEAARRDAAGHPSVAALRTAGLLGRDESPAGPPRDLSRAHGVWAVDLADRQQVVVKSGAFTSALAADGDADEAEAPSSLGAELFVQRLAAWCPALREALPAAVAVDETDDLLVVAAAGSASLALRADEFAHDAALFRLLGRRLGAVHRETAGLPIPPAATPLIFAALGAKPVALTERTAQVVALLRADTRAIAAAARLRTPAGRCLVHHDLKWDNIAVDGRTPVLVDWELAGAGDPAWDLGCLVAEHLLRAGGGRRDLDDGAVALLRGYAAGARVSARALPVFAERTALAAALRLAQFALEVAERGTDDDATTARAIASQALAQLHASTNLAEEMSGCLATPRP